MQEQKTGFFSNIKHDFPASIVVFLVALPLCLGIALASGANENLFSGIIAGIVGGILVALLSGSALGVSGPAAGLAVIVFSAIQDLGFEAFLLAVVFAGIIQFVLGILKAGVIGYYFPSSVIKGMLSGIGILIFLKQIPHAFGYDKDPEGDWSFFQADGHNTFSEFVYMAEAITPGAVVITVVSLAILILWESPFMRKVELFKIINGPLVAVIAGITLNILFNNIGVLVISPEHLVSIPVSGSIGEFATQFTLPDFGAWNNPQVYVVAFTIAIVASLETLLCVEATDKLDPQKRITPTNRELLAQGVGNTVSGLIGGLPVTQVIVRSSANIQSGGKSRASAFIHGILLLISAVAIPKVLNLIPLSSLAAILFMVGYKLAKPSLFMEMKAKGKSEFYPFVVTILGMIFTDLLTGIFMGLVLAIFQILWYNYKTPYHFDPEAYEEGKPVYIKMSEDVSFLNKAGMLHTFEMIPDNAKVIVDARSTKWLHPDIEEIIHDFERNAESRGIEVELLGMQEVKSKDSIKEFNKIIPRSKLDQK